MNRVFFQTVLVPGNNSWPVFMNSAPLLPMGYGRGQFFCGVDPGLEKDQIIEGEKVVPMDEFYNVPTGRRLIERFVEWVGDWHMQFVGDLWEEPSEFMLVFPRIEELLCLWLGLTRIGSNLDAVAKGVVLLDCREGGISSIYEFGDILPRRLANGKVNAVNAADFDIMAPEMMRKAIKRVESKLH